jgi:ribokinase
VSEVVVVGSANMDVIAVAPRHPVVGETVLGTALRFAPGGKGANQAVAAARFGARTRMVGRVGRDAFGDSLVAFLDGEGIGGLIRDADQPTGTALIVVDEQGENTIVVVPGANGAMTVADLGRLDGDVLVAQFEIPLAVVEAALRATRATTVLNPAPALVCPQSLLEAADIVVVNETEAAALAGRLPARKDQVVVTTLGAAGARVGAMTVPGRAVAVVDTTGAGDCFVGALAAALAGGESIEGAVRVANVAASLSVQRFGAGPSMPTRAEVEALL